MSNKILLYTDNHFCEKASIINMYGTKYSTRIENQLTSINWVEELAASKGCAAVFCLGDFFDSAELSDKEITAVQDIKWNNLYHYFIVGNHESSESSLECNSTKILEGPNREILSNTTVFSFPNCDLCILPYVVESDRRQLSEYFGAKTDKKRIILSHNDIKGIQLGPVISREGFPVDEIEANCDLFVNGHLHNGQFVTNKILNLGNLTGKDFGENALKYKHNVMILDLDTLEYELIENPYAFNFYTIKIEEKQDLEVIKSLRNALVTFKCKESLVEDLREYLELYSKNIIKKRELIIKESSSTGAEFDISTLMMDHLTKFAEFCKSVIDNSDVLEAELAEVLK